MGAAESPENTAGDSSRPQELPASTYNFDAKWRINNEKLRLV